MSTNPFKAGDKVRYLPEWQDDGDEFFDLIVIEAPEDSDRILVEVQIPELSIKPTERVPISYLTKIL
jgi:hypothetical protein